jgi:hypothetical protein
MRCVVARSARRTAHPRARNSSDTCTWTRPRHGHSSPRCVAHGRPWPSEDEPLSRSAPRPALVGAGFCHGQRAQPNQRYAPRGTRCPAATCGRKPSPRRCLVSRAPRQAVRPACPHPTCPYPRRCARVRRGDSARAHRRAPAVALLLLRTHGDRAGARLQPDHTADLRARSAPPRRCALPATHTPVTLGCARSLARSSQQQRAVQRLGRRCGGALRRSRSQPVAAPCGQRRRLPCVPLVRGCAPRTVCAHAHAHTSACRCSRGEEIVILTKDHKPEDPDEIDRVHTGRWFRAHSLAPAALCRSRACRTTSCEARGSATSTSRALWAT